MITQMRKYSYFIFEPEYHSFLKQLRELGVVHVQERNDPSQVEHIRAIDEQLNELTELRKKLLKVISTTETNDSVLQQDVTLQASKIKNYEELKAKVESLSSEIEEKQKQLDSTRSQIRDLMTWGDFDPNLIDKLSGSGYYLHFWTVLTPQFNPEWVDLFNADIINQVGRSTYFITITRDPEGPGLEYAEQIKLPHTSIRALEVRENTIKSQLHSLNSLLLALAYKGDIIDAKEIELKNEYKFDSAYYQGEKLYDNKLVILEGWVPTEQATEMEHCLDKLGFAYSELDITPGENVPIKLKNNRFNRVFEPILELFSLPNYWEIDPTPLFAPFFLLFFGMCFGDSGYGLLLLLLSTIFKRKAKPSMKGILELLQWLGVSGAVVGFFSGSFFGVELVKVPFLQSIKSFFLSTNNLMVISLVVGVVQIIFGKYVAAVKTKKQEGIKASLSGFAWPTLILVLAVMIGLPFLHLTLPKPVEYLLMGIAGICVLLALFYNSPGKNIFINLGQGLWHTYSMVSGLLGDTLSYIRLFAIGLTGAILGQVFNTLAMTTTSSLPWYAAIPVGFVILILGHTINFGLTTISSLVHPVRLIYVEYFNNSKYEGGGKKYDPLKTISSDGN